MKLRAEANLEQKYDEAKTGKEVAVKVLNNISDMAHSLPNPDLSYSMTSELNKIIEKLKI